MAPSQTLPLGSNPTSSEPRGSFGSIRGIGYSRVLPVLGSSLPRYSEPKSEYHTIPCGSTAASCGKASGRGKSYSVMITFVALPLGRAFVFRGYSHWEVLLRFTLAIYSARFATAADATCCPSIGPAASPPVAAGPLGRTCGRLGVLP